MSTCERVRNWKRRTGEPHMPWQRTRRWTLAGEDIVADVVESPIGSSWKSRGGRDDDELGPSTLTNPLFLITRLQVNFSKT